MIYLPKFVAQYHTTLLILATQLINISKNILKRRKNMNLLLFLGILLMLVLLSFLFIFYRKEMAKNKKYIIGIVLGLLVYTVTFVKFKGIAILLLSSFLALFLLIKLTFLMAPIIHSSAIIIKAKILMPSKTKKSSYSLVQKKL